METDLLPDEAAAKLAKSAERAAKLALVCLVVAVLVLAIDNRLKKHIIEEGKRALLLLEEARRLAEEARGGAPGTGQDGAGAGAAVDSADGVVHAAGASAAAGADARRGPRKAPGRSAGEA